MDSMMTTTPKVPCRGHWWQRADDVRLKLVQERVARGLQWLKSNVPEWETKDYRSVRSVMGANCILTTAAGSGMVAYYAHQLWPDGGLVAFGFNAYSSEDDRRVVREWRRVLRAEGVTA